MSSKFSKKHKFQNWGQTKDLKIGVKFHNYGQIPNLINWSEISKLDQKTGIKCMLESGTHNPFWVNFVYFLTNFGGQLRNMAKNWRNLA